MGRRPLDPKAAPVKLTVRITRALVDRIEAAAGENRVSEFMREAAEEKLKRAERQKPAPNPSKPSP